MLDSGGGGVALGAAPDAVAAAASALRDGAIVAVKGVGGYHLACRADDQRAVSALRARKHREDKPFAVMAPDLAAARRLVALGAAQARLLVCAERPIVLAPRVAGAPVAEAVAPGALELGVMLPYAPLHHLLLADSGAPLVMTSGNVSDEPIAHADDDALERLAGLADLFLVHDRPIETRTDDSVLRTVRWAGCERRGTVRRSRGLVPAARDLPGGTPRPLLACGAELKNTFCLARDQHAWVSHHIGDLENYATLRSFLDGIEHFQRLFAVTPEVVVHDLHPEYLSSKYALEREGVSLIGVQHHHAHMAACLAEHGHDGPALGLIFDGSGYGSDATIWGGELLYGDRTGFTRAGLLWPVRLPGGERAVREPWRMACAWLQESGRGSADPPPALADAVTPAAWRAVRGLVQGGPASPLTTSVGRLFDAVAALCGLRAHINYEGQAAIELERACDPGERGRYPISVSRDGQRLVLDPREMIRAVADDVRGGVPTGVVASRFHAGLAAGAIEAAAHAADARDTDVVVVSGGVFGNRRLLEAVADGLAAAGLRVLVPEQLPVNDGGLAYGQAAVAAQRLRAG
jgi:hydrogenase maturation protein HypF